ncbi:MAG: DUF2065 domain-containing protein [Alphaproteobacteria bacterium]
MSDFLAALGLVLVIEGIVYAAAPECMKRLMARFGTLSAGTLRAAGLAAAVIGVIIVWLARS